MAIKIEAGNHLKADLLMAIEVFNQIIATGNLAELSGRICAQLRELSGARLIMLIKHDEILDQHSIAGISPLRRINEFTAEQLALFCPLHDHGKDSLMVDDLPDHDLRRMLQEKQINSMLRYPLVIDGRLIGTIALLDLPDVERVNEISEIIHFLITAIALSVKNAMDNELILVQAEGLKLLNESLEHKVYERTRELEKLNQHLEEAHNKAMQTMEAAEKARNEALELAAALRQSEEKFRVLFEESAEGILVAELDGSRFVYANPAMCDLLGYKREELVCLGVVNIHPEEIRETAVREFSNMVDNATSYLSSFPCLRKDGSTVFVDIKASQTKFNGQQYIVGFFADVTYRRMQEENLQRAAKLDSLGILAGGIAHDFNNLLGGIFGYIELSLDRVYDATALKYLTTALGTIDRARALTQQLLTFAKGGNPQKKVEPLVPFIQETAVFSLSGANLTCSFSFPENLWSCNYDRNQLAQVIDNIIINARQAMVSGGKLEISAENIIFKEGSHSLLAAGKYVKISIRDDGPGIAAELLPRVFDPFFTTKEMGHGLGLAVCYSIIRKHEGSLEVESNVGSGCTFHILLPAADVNAVEVKPPVVPNLHSGFGTFLVMDDEEVVRNIIASILEALGYKVVKKGDGAQVIEWLKTEASNCNDLTAMIFDLTVPGGLGGIETLNEMKELGISLPTFVTSGYAEDPVMAKPADYGFIASIRKPFRMAELAALLEEHLNKKPV